MKSIERIISRQRNYFSSGETKVIESRIGHLKRFKRAVENNYGDLVSALRNDLGKSEFEAYMTEIGITLKEIETMIYHLPRWSRDKRVGTPLFLFPGRSRIMYEPYGVVLIIAPWNYPMQLALTPLAGAVAAGNCAVVKVSQNTPTVASVIGKVLEEAFPPELVTVTQNTPEMREQILEGTYDYIFFTGGSEFAHTVMDAAARNLTPMTLELGGKSPCVVGPEADLDTAARRIMWGKLINAGQTCIAPDYLMAHRSVADKLLSQVKTVTAEFYGENPKSNNDYPRIVSEKEAERLAAMIATSGGKIVMGGETDTKERFISPTVVMDVDPGHDLMRKEIFGPILPVVLFDELDEVADFINSRPKPLAMYYFGSPKNGRRLLSATSSGGACINDTLMHYANPNLPFGGVGNSGMGKYHGRESFLTFSNRRAVLSSSTLIDFKVRYAPFKALRLLKKVL